MTKSTFDWHSTQNHDYLALVSGRLMAPPLRWCCQFRDLINSFICENKLTDLSINDVGCNVGHFARMIQDIDTDVVYHGLDLSQTYLSIATKAFPGIDFQLLDISVQEPLHADVTVCSATLEHIISYQDALANILKSSRRLVLLRTFTGDKYSIDDCKTLGADASYPIQQFTEDYLRQFGTNFGFSLERYIDCATGSEPKLVCNYSSIERTQYVYAFKKDSSQV